MRPVCVAIAVALLRGSGAQSFVGGQLPPRPRIEHVPDARIDRLVEWVKAIERHRPGREDEALQAIRRWHTEELRDLLTDAPCLAKLILNPLTSGFIDTTQKYARVEVGYTNRQLARMRLLACAIQGVRIETPCLADHDQPNDPVLAQLARHGASAWESGDRNYFVRRAAMFHTDIVTLAGPTPDTPSVSSPTAVRLTDGVGALVMDLPQHWQIARAILDHVVLQNATRPAPGRDRMVRDWYVATASWMEFSAQHRSDHLQRGRELFPNDAAILFLSGWQHETYSSPMIQDAARTASESQATLPIASEQHELAEAERFFRRVLAIEPGNGVARIRLGHVLLRQGRYTEATQALERLVADTVDVRQQYYCYMFNGAANEALGRLDRARASYQAAVQLFPLAQSPHVALSELAWIRGDRALALTELNRITSLSGPESDPWWTYSTSAVHDPGPLLDQLRRSLSQ